jgi:DNA-binding NarL/FixJ family response regulator
MAIGMSSVAEPQAVRIVIADDQPIFRHGLRRLLEARPCLRVVGELGDSAAAIGLVRELQPDVLILGAANADSGVLETLRQVAALGLAVRTILLTGPGTTSAMMAAVELGARGVVPKDSPADALFSSIDCVMAGRFWIGVECGGNLRANVRRFEVERRQAKAFGLTPRELEIMRAVVAGRTNKAVALQFSISENTVKRHLMHIFDKVGASNRVELARFAAHHQVSHLR